MAPGWEEEEEHEEAAQPHVVFFPLPVQGHLNPYLSIAHYLASNGIRVTFIHAPSASSASFDQSGPSIRFEVLPELDALLPLANAVGQDADSQKTIEAAADTENPETEPNPLRHLFRNITDPLRRSLEDFLRKLFLPESELPRPFLPLQGGHLALDSRCGSAVRPSSGSDLHALCGSVLHRAALPGSSCEGPCLTCEARFTSSREDCGFHPRSANSVLKGSAIHPGNRYCDYETVHCASL